MLAMLFQERESLMNVYIKYPAFSTSSPKQITWVQAYVSKGQMLQPLRSCTQTSSLENYQ